MKCDYSPDVRSLYIYLRPPDDAPEIEATVELETEVLADLDATGEPVGVELVDADDLFPFLASHAHGNEVPVRLDLPDLLVEIVRRRVRQPVA